MDFTIEMARQLIKRTHQNIESNKKYLEELDSLMGDGDLGLTMTKGFAAAQQYAEQSEDTDIGKFFMKIGTTFSKAVPSTMGTLMASAFLSAGKAVSAAEKLSEEQLGVFFVAFAEGVQKRGKCKLGDRTIFDVLYPTGIAISEAAQQKKDFESISEIAYKTAQEELENTKQMSPTTGKALYHADKSKGVPDQGAVVGMIVFQSFYELFH